VINPDQKASGLCPARTRIDIEPVFPKPSNASYSASTRSTFTNLEPISVMPPSPANTETSVIIGDASAGWLTLGLAPRAGWKDLRNCGTVLAGGKVKRLSS